VFSMGARTRAPMSFLGPNNAVSYNEIC